MEQAFNPHPGHSEGGFARGRAEAGELAGGGRFAGALPAGSGGMHACSVKAQVGVLVLPERKRLRSTVVHAIGQATAARSLLLAAAPCL